MLVLIIYYFISHRKATTVDDSEVVITQRSGENSVRIQISASKGGGGAAGEGGLKEQESQTSANFANLVGIRYLEVP